MNDSHTHRRHLSAEEATTMNTTTFPRTGRPTDWTRRTQRPTDWTRF